MLKWIQHLLGLFMSKPANRKSDAHQEPEWKKYTWLMGFYS